MGGRPVGPGWAGEDSHLLLLSYVRLQFRTHVESGSRAVHVQATHGYVL